MGVNHDRIREISTEMSGLVDEQTRLLKSPTRFPDISGEELDGYTQRNERLRQLCKELNELG